jgi:hypothetical protein
MFKKLLKLELSQYLVKFVSIYSLLMGFILALFGIACIAFSNKLTTLLEAGSEPGGIFVLIVVGAFCLIAGLYAFITGIGLWNYENYGRIMLLILLYACIVFAVIYLIVGIFSLFVAWYLGVYLIVFVVFFAIMLFLTIYLFQSQKQIVALFKKRR